MSFIVVIPARYQSTRLPAKPLADILGKTMIERVAEQAIKSGAKHIGSYVYKVGGPTNVIIRLFEWESLEQWEKWNKWLFGSQEGKDLLARISKYGVLTEAYLLTPAPTA